MRRNSPTTRITGDNNDAMVGRGRGTGGYFASEGRKESK